MWGECRSFSCGVSPPRVTRERNHLAWDVRETTEDDFAEAARGNVGGNGGNAGGNRDASTEADTAAEKAENTNKKRPTRAVFVLGGRE